MKFQGVRRVTIVLNYANPQVKKKEEDPLLFLTIAKFLLQRVIGNS